MQPEFESLTYSDEEADTSSPEPTRPPEILPSLPIIPLTSSSTTPYAFPHITPRPNDRRKYIFAPDIQDAQSALADLSEIVHPKRKKGGGAVKRFEGDDLLRERLRMMQHFLWAYIDPSQYLGWIAASERVAHNFQKSTTSAEWLRQWTRAFMRNRDALPYNLYGQWTPSLLEKGELAYDIKVHLQGIGKYVRAQDIVEFLDTPDIKIRYGLSKTISLSTAKRWMSKMDYRWRKSPSGLYVDGHEREDVVAYRQEVFLPRMAELEIRMYTGEPTAGLSIRLICYWLHDETTFTAHDRQETGWVHESETPVPRPKGEGPSLMVSDFISEPFGWLRSPDGRESARVLFKAGKNREGYFTNDDILKQLRCAIDIVKRHYPQFDHYFGLDNARTHLKREEHALSARKMPKNPTPSPNQVATEGDSEDPSSSHAAPPPKRIRSKKRKPSADTAGSEPPRPRKRQRQTRKKKDGPPEIWGVDVTVYGPDGKVVHGPDGKPLKRREQMGCGTLPDGCLQSLYYPSTHPKYPSAFKGMAEILVERGYPAAPSLRYECPKFACAAPATPLTRRFCCCRRILYEEPDFVNVESLVEKLCREQGVEVIFLPKFHCELNPIERCWSHAKRVYRLNPASSSEDDLEQNVVAALGSVPLESMRRYVLLVD